MRHRFLCFWGDIGGGKDELNILKALNQAQSRRQATENVGNGLTQHKTSIAVGVSMKNPTRDSPCYAEESNTYG